MRKFRCGKFAILLMLLIATYSSAQVATASIEGDVKDPTGASVPSATVTLLSTETGLTRTINSDSTGRYSFAQIPVGQYEIHVAAPGFAKLARKGIVLVVGQAAVLILQLTVGKNQEVVDVAEKAPLLESVSPTVSGVIDEDEVRQLPLNTRSFTSLATQEPSVTNFVFAKPSSSWTEAISHQGSLMVVNGQMGAVSFLMDGMTIADSTNRGAPGTVAGDLLGVEAIREFNILTHNYEAEYGHSSGAVINYVTKGGTNSLHGSVYEFARNGAMDARNYFDPTTGVPPFSRNQFGASLGGPIKKDRSFFFINYEGFRQSLTTTSVAIVPDANARNGILPSGNVTVSPAVIPFLNLYPAANGPDLGGGLAQLNYANSQPANQNYVSGKFDQQLSVNDHLMIRYTYTGANTSQAFSVPTFISDNTSRNQYLTLQETHTLSSYTINSASFGFNRSRSDLGYKATVPIDNSMFFVPDRGIMGGITFGALISQFGGGSNAQVSSIGTDGTGPIESASNIYQFEDMVTHIAGKHTLKFGGQFRRYQDNKQFVLDGAGNYTFNTLQNFLTANPANVVICPSYCDQIHDWRTSWFGFYANDNWRVNDKLTLTLGLRYEFNTMPTIVGGHYANLDPIDSTSWRVGTTSGVVDNFYPYKQGSVFAKNPTLRQFEPRIGVAYQIIPNTVLRMGGGVFHNFISLTDLQNQIPNEGPFGGLSVFIGSGGPLAFPQLPAGSVPVARIPGGYVGSEGTTTTYQWNLAIERAITPDMKVNVTYLGQRGNHLGRWSVWNTKIGQVQPDGQEYFPANEPTQLPGWPAGSQVTGSVPDANSWYHGLDVGFEQRFSHGLQIRADYLFSRATTNSEDSFLVNWAGNVPPAGPDAYHAERDWGLNAFNPNQRVTFSYQWQLPMGNGHWLGGNATGAADKIVSGWSLTGINSIQSGLPLTPYVGYNISGNGNSAGPGDRPNLVPGCSNNPVLGSPNEYFNVNCFSLPQPGYSGNLGRDSVIGPGLISIDLALMKNTPITEKTRLEIRAEVFNLPNHTNFGVPNITLFQADGSRNPAAGKIFSTSTNSRQIQLGAKFIF